MRDFDEFSITQAVLEQVGKAPSARTRQISEAAVRHLHAFVREIEPSIEEWEWAIGFLTEVGQKCSGTRQEFILLSDTLGVSMLVDAINHRLPKGATETTVLGPFYVQNPPEFPLGADISPGVPGRRLYVEGTARTTDGRPLAGAIVDVWHSDEDGYYDVQHYDEGGEVTMRARLRADQDGRFWFWTVVPSFYPIPYDGPVGLMLKAQGRHPYRPAHVHFMLQAPGYEKLATHVFVDGDKYLNSDVVFGVKNSLIRSLEEHPAGLAPDDSEVSEPYSVMRYDFALAPKQEPKGGQGRAA